MMSMPMHLLVVVVGTHAQTACAAASILRGEEDSSIRPWISAAHVEPPTNRSSFSFAGSERSFKIEAAASYYFMNARKVHLWLALDAEAAGSVRTYIMHNGPAPDGFYRGVFPEAVVPCGFDTSWMPSTGEALDHWIITLEKNLEPWKQRIWDAFRDSS
jgi:hypothetical protein